MLLRSLSPSTVVLSPFFASLSLLLLLPRLLPTLLLLLLPKMMFYTPPAAAVREFAYVFSRSSSSTPSLILFPLPVAATAWSIPYFGYPGGLNTIQTAYTNTFSDCLLYCQSFNDVRPTSCIGVQFKLDTKVSLVSCFPILPLSPTPSLSLSLSSFSRATILGLRC